MRIFILMIAAYFAVFSGACHKTVSNEISIPEIETAVVESSVIAPWIEAFGTIEYKSNADVYPTSQGNISEILVEEGTFVNTGTVLAVLDKRKMLMQLEQAQCDVYSKEAQLKLAVSKLREGENDIAKKLLELEIARIKTSQARYDYENLQKTYSNKLLLHDAGGMSDEELRTVTISLEQYRNQLSLTELDLAYAETGFSDDEIIRAGFQVPENPEERKKLLIKINTNTLLAQVEEAMAELKGAEAERDNISLYLEEMDIKAPISGIIGKRYMDIGEKADADTLIFTIFDTSSVYVSGELNASRMGNIKTGEPGIVILNKDARDGKVAFISPYADSRTGGREVKILIDNSDNALIPGLFAEMKILTGEEKERICLPLSALVDEKHVFILRGENVYLQDVAVDFQEGNKVYISSGLNMGDVVATSHKEFLQDGMKVLMKKGDIIK